MAFLGHVDKYVFSGVHTQTCQKKNVYLGSILFIILPHSKLMIGQWCHKNTT